MKTIFATCTATLALLAGPAIAQTKAPAVTASTSLVRSCNANGLAAWHSAATRAGPATR